MNDRTWTTVIPVMRRTDIGLLAAGLVASALMLTACGESSSRSPATITSPSSTSNFRGAVISPGFTLPSVALTDTSGHAWNLAKRARGRITVVYFGYTNCPDVCPTDMADLATARRDLPGDLRGRVDLVFITVDQKRDTAPVIRAWLDRFDKTMVGLTGTPKQLAAAARALHVPYRVGATPQGLEEVEHGSQMTAFSADGTSRLAWLDGTPVTDISHDMGLLAQGQTPAA